MPLCEFLKVYYDRLSKLSIKNSMDYSVPSMELLKICIEQLQACEIDKFRNLNKLAVIMNMIGSLVRVPNMAILLKDQDQSNSGINAAQNNRKLFIQLIRSLVQVFKSNLKSNFNQVLKISIELR